MIDEGRSLRRTSEENGKTEQPSQRSDTLLPNPCGVGEIVFSSIHPGNRARPSRPIKERNRPMNITPELRSVFQRVISEYGNPSQFAKSIGVAHSTVLFWLNGKSPTISGRIWIGKVRPALLPFLSREEQILFAPDTMIHRNLSASANAPGTGNSRKPAPLFSAQQLLDFDPVFESIDSFIRRTAKIGSCPFTIPTSPVRFALNWPAAEPLPFALNALVDGSARPLSGEIAAAVVQESDRIVIGSFSRNGDHAEIIPILENHPEAIRWNTRNEPNFLRWIFPVLEFDRVLK